MSADDAARNVRRYAGAPRGMTTPWREALAAPVASIQSTSPRSLAALHTKK